MHISKSLKRYIIVGSIAAIIEYGSFYGLYFGLHWPLYIANSISFGLALLTSFLLNRLWTFKGKESYNKKTIHQFGYYLTLSFINLLLTNIVIGVFWHIGINPSRGKLIAMVITSLWNYVIFKQTIFTYHMPIEK